MKSLVLVGGGGHCRSCIEVIEACGQFHISGIVQQKPEPNKTLLGYPIVGTDGNLEKILTKGMLALVTVGQIKSPDVRMSIFSMLRSLGGELPVIVAPTAYCSRHATIGDGTIIMHGALVNACAHIGENCIINSQALVEHDAHIGSHCHISTGSRVNGGVSIGTGSFIGSGAIVREEVTIGEYSIVGAGQVIMRDIPPHSLVRGLT